MEDEVPRSTPKSMGGLANGLLAEEGFVGDDVHDQAREAVAVLGEAGGQLVHGLFVGEVEGASKRVGEQLRGQGLGELVLVGGQQMLFEPGHALELLALWKFGPGIDGLRFGPGMGAQVLAPESDGVVLLEGDAPGVDVSVAVGAGRLFAVDFHLFPDGEVFVLGVLWVEFGHVGRRGCWWVAKDAVQQPHGSADGMGLLAVGVGQEDAGLGEESAPVLGGL